MRFGYRTPVLPWLLRFSLAVFGVAAVALLIAAAAGGGPPVSFVAMFVAAVAGLYAGFGWLIGTSVEVSAGVVTWRAVFHRRCVALEAIAGNGASWNLKWLRVRGGVGLPILAMGGDDWSRFLDALSRVHPTRSFEPTSSDRLSARWGNPLGLRGYFEQVDEGTE